jgi:hypothetical protein
MRPDYIYGHRRASAPHVRRPTIMSHLMKLLDEIVELTTSDAEGLSVLLRKCLVLSYTLKSDRLRDWVDKELNGYGDNDQLPEYRKFSTISKGFFVGSFDAQINDQPLQTSVLKREHRHIANSAQLREPIAAYDKLVGGTPSDGEGEFRSEWPPDLTAHYQQKFIQDFVLNRAWRVIPRPALLALLDTIRNGDIGLAVPMRAGYDRQQHLSAAFGSGVWIPPPRMAASVFRYVPISVISG